MTSRRRRYVWARFIFWVLTGVAAATDQVLRDHPLWMHVVLFIGAVVCWIAAAQAWKELERTA